MTYNIRSYVGNIATDTPIETTCQTIRIILGLSLDWAFKEYSMGDAIRKLVTRMEDSGTMVCINNMVGNNTFRKLRRISPTFMILCTCLAEIKESYTKVRHRTAEVAQQKFDIDDYLDMVIVVRKKLEEITDETNNLVETVRNHFTEFDEQETTELLAHSTPILILMDQLHQKLAESPLYPGLKTAAENYRDCVSDFQELCSDLQTFNIDVPRNEKCREVEELLRKLA